MKLTHFGRLAPAVAIAAFAVACADQSSPVGPSALATGTTFNVSATAAGEGELQICKAGNQAGTFSFSYTIVQTLGSPGGTVAQGTINVDVGQCATAAQLPTIGSGRYLATVTETSIPANWAVTSISATNSTATPVGWPVPVISLATATASNVGMANDVGATVTFTNTYTPPPPPYCTLTQGYWKTHTEDWDNGEKYVDAGDTFYNSGKTYVEIMNTPPAGGNAYLQLAHQFIAASLNINGLSGSGYANVDTALAGADAYFAGAAAGTPSPTGALRTQLLGWASTLTSFNEGTTGPGHCD